MEWLLAWRGEMALRYRRFCSLNASQHRFVLLKNTMISKRIKTINVLLKQMSRKLQSAP